MNFAYIGSKSDLHLSLRARFDEKNDRLRLYTSLDSIIAESLQETCDAIVIDFDLYSFDYALRLIQCIRIFNPDIPIFVVMVVYTPESAQKLFSIGVTDCYKKPSDLLEIVVRIRNHSFNTAINQQLSQIAIGEHYVYNTFFSTLTYKGNTQNFSKTESAFLRLLIENKDSFISPDDIAAYVYSDNDRVESTTIRSLVSRLRKKLHEDFIESAHGFGYRLKIQ